RESGLLEYYVLGLLSDQEKAQVEGYIKSFPELQKDYIEIQLSVQEYAKVQGITPKVDLLDKIMNLIRAQGLNTPVPPRTSYGSDQAATGSGGSSWARGLAFLFGIISIGALWYGWDRNNDYQTLSRDHAALQTECDSITQAQSTRLTLFD